MRAGWEHPAPGTPTASCSPGLPKSLLCKWPVEAHFCNSAGKGPARWGFLSIYSKWLRDHRSQFLHVFVHFLFTKLAYLVGGFTGFLLNWGRAGAKFKGPFTIFTFRFDTPDSTAGWSNWRWTFFPADSQQSTPVWYGSKLRCWYPKTPQG